MKSFISRIAVTLIVLAAPSAAPVARAGLLSALEASALVQSTASDTDFGFLGLLTGFQSGQTLDYNSTSTTTAWSATLSGSYLGSGANVAYSGDLSGYPSGAITWTSAGTYGTENWSGAGAATIMDTSSTTFQVSFSSSLAVGAGTASMQYTIPGSVLPDGTFMFGDPSNGEVGTGSLTLDGVGFTNVAIVLSYRTEGGFAPDSPRTLIVSDIFGYPIGGLGLLNKDYVVIPLPFSMSISGTITSVPEPPSILLVASGILVLVPIRFCTRRKTPRKSCVHR
jgi:hypothetical protein